MYKITKISEPYVKKTRKGYAVCVSVNNATPIMLGWVYDDKMPAEKELEYLKQVILEKEED